MNRDQLCRTIVDNAPDAVIVGDRDGNILLWNAGAEAVFGFDAAEAMGRPMDLIIPENLRARHWDGYRRTMATGATKYGAKDLLAVPAVRKDGARISIEFSIVPLRDEAGALAGVAAIIRDVTERWKREKALKERVAALEGGKPAAG